MSDVNEELVRRYYELKGYFVRTNVWYEFRTRTGMGHSDLDLCVFHPITGDAAIVEVKGWHTERITPAYIRAWPRLFYFVRKEALREAKKLLGHAKFRRVLVVSQLGVRNADEVKRYAKKKHRVEIVEFSEVLRYLIDHTPTNRGAGSESEHVIRLMKIYGLTRPD
ncbi:MAG: hypothetical protein ACJ75Q_05765 [Gaiellaceae bacterium]